MSFVEIGTIVRSAVLWKSLPENMLDPKYQLDIHLEVWDRQLHMERLKDITIDLVLGAREQQATRHSHLGGRHG